MHQQARKKMARTAMLLLMIFASYQVCTTVFGHAHWVDGNLLVHSHPYSTPQHTHTTVQFLTLAELSCFAGLEPMLPVLLTAVTSVFAVSQIIRNRDTLPTQHPGQHQLRAPPAATFFTALYA